MVMDLIDISPKELKKAQKIFNALYLLGISQQDLLNIKSFKIEIDELKNKINELEDWKYTKIREENERIKSYQKDKDIEIQKYINDTGVEFNPYGK